MERRIRGFWGGLQDELGEQGSSLVRCRGVFGVGDLWQEFQFFYFYFLVILILDLFWVVLGFRVGIGEVQRGSFESFWQFRLDGLGQIFRILIISIEQVFICQNSISLVQGRVLGVFIKFVGYEESQGFQGKAIERKEVRGFIRQLRQSLGLQLVGFNKI